jgi:hypothetical protein
MSGEQKWEALSGAPLLHLMFVDCCGIVASASEIIGRDSLSPSEGEWRRPLQATGARIANRMKREKAGCGAAICCWILASDIMPQVHALGINTSVFSDSQMWRICREPTLCVDM